MVIPNSFEAEKWNRDIIEDEILHPVREILPTVIKTDFSTV